MSPEMLEMTEDYLSYMAEDEIFDFFLRNDIFSIGLIILYLILLPDNDEFQNW